MERADIARTCEDISHGIWARLEHRNVKNTGHIIENSDGSCCLPQNPIKDNSVPIRKTVNLDDVDFIGFKSLCAEIFASAGYFIEDMPPAGSGLYMVSQDGVRMFAACMHRMKYSIDLEYVRSTHYFCISKYNHAKSFVINTGTFTAGAVEQAQKLTDAYHSIELYDLQKLTDMAAKVGIRIADYPQTFMCPILDFDKLVDMVIKDANLQDDHDRLRSMFDVQVRVMTYKACWLADATVRRDFTESVGVIHSVDKRETCLISDTDRDVISTFHESLKALPDISIRSMEDMPDFHNDSESMKDIIKRRMADRHGNTIKYVGRHGTVHEEWCRPTLDDVTLHRVTKVYVPVYSIKFTRKWKSHNVEVTSINQKLDFTRNDLEECGVCHKMPHEPTLCRLCGNIMHRRSIWDVIGGRCAFECSRCGKNVCMECTEHTGRIFKRYFCADCTVQVK